jgi:hypothetical protein
MASLLLKGERRCIREEWRRGQEGVGLNWNPLLLLLLLSSHLNLGDEVVCVCVCVCVCACVRARAWDAGCKFTTKTLPTCWALSSVLCAALWCSCYISNGCFHYWGCWLNRHTLFNLVVIFKRKDRIIWSCSLCLCDHDWTNCCIFNKLCQRHAARGHYIDVLFNFLPSLIPAQRPYELPRWERKNRKESLTISSIEYNF